MLSDTLTDVGGAVVQNITSAAEPIVNQALQTLTQPAVQNVLEQVKNDTKDVAPEGFDLSFLDVLSQPDAINVDTIVGAIDGLVDDESDLGGIWGTLKNGFFNTENRRGSRRN